MIDKIKLFRKDVIITPYEKNALNGSIIHVVEYDEGKEGLNFFKVLRVSDKVESVKEGDIVILKMGKHTPPSQFGDVRAAITSEDDIEAIVEL